MKAANVGGTQEVLRLACTAEATPVHYVSTNAVFDASEYFGQNIRFAEEELSVEPSTIRGGYAQSKWVAERLVSQAGQRGLPVVVYRPGGIFDSSRTGIMNKQDLLTLLLQLTFELGYCPDNIRQINFLPVDFISLFIVRRALQPTVDKTIYHLVHPEPLLPEDFILALDAIGVGVTKLPFAAWRAGINKYIESSTSDRYRVFQSLLIIPWLRERSPGWN